MKTIVGTLVWLMVVVSLVAVAKWRAPWLGRAGPAPPLCPGLLVAVEVAGRGLACLSSTKGHAGDVLPVPSRWRRRMRTGRLEALAIPLDPNHADVRELTSLPGVGPKLAEAIVAGRPYRTAVDVGRVRGLGRARLAKVLPRLTVGELP